MGKPDSDPRSVVGALVARGCEDWKELGRSLTANQKVYLLKLTDCLKEMHGERNRPAFVEGWAVAKGNQRQLLN